MLKYNGIKIFLKIKIIWQKRLFEYEKNVPLRSEIY